MTSKISHYSKLKNLWIEKHKKLQEKVYTKHKEAFHWLAGKIPVQQLVSGSMGGLLLLAQPATVLLPAPHLLLASAQNRPLDLDKDTSLMLDLLEKVPQDVRPLTQDEEKNITDILSKDFGFSITAQLQGIRLERNYGFIGQEQHLMLYPGDTIFSHFVLDEDAYEFAKYQMAPGKGAWGYFANSKSDLTETDIQREKYYIAVQTFLSPGFSENVAKYRDFFKYKKMLVINPHTGKSIVADIADAGPGIYTGKQLGGSPEVMRYLEREDGKRKGPVLFFFIDDPTNVIPLGPIKKN